MFNNFGSPNQNTLRSPPTNNSLSGANSAKNAPTTTANSNHPDFSGRLNMNLSTSLAMTGKSQSSSNVRQGIHSNNNIKQKPHTAKHHFLNRANSMDFQHRINIYRFNEDSMISNDDSMMSDYYYTEDGYMPMTSTSASILDTSSQHDISHYFRQINVNCSHEQEQKQKKPQNKSNQPTVSSGSSTALNTDTATNAIGNVISETISKQISHQISNEINSNCFTNILNNQLSNQMNNQINATINGPINEAINNTLNVSTLTSTPLTTTQIVNAAKSSIDLDKVITNTTNLIQATEPVLNTPVVNSQCQIVNDPLTLTVQDAVEHAVKSQETHIKLENQINATLNVIERENSQNNQAKMFPTIPEEEKNEMGINQPTSTAQSIQNFMNDSQMNNSSQLMLPPPPVIPKTEPLNSMPGSQQQSANGSPVNQSDMMSLANVEQLVQNTIGMNNTVNYMPSSMNPPINNGSNMLINRTRSSPEHAFISQNSQTDLRVIQQPQQQQQQQMQMTQQQPQSPQLIQSPPQLMPSPQMVQSQSSLCQNGQMMMETGFNMQPNQQQQPQTTRSNSMYDDLNIKKELPCTISNMMVTNDNIIQSRMSMNDANNNSPPNLMRNLSVNNLILSDQNNPNMAVNNLNNNGNMIGSENNLSGSLPNSMNNNMSNMGNNLNNSMNAMMQSQMNLPQPMDTTQNVMMDNSVSMQQQQQQQNAQQQQMSYQQMIINEMVQNSSPPSLDQNQMMGNQNNCGLQSQNCDLQQQQRQQSAQSQNLQVQNQQQEQANNSNVQLQSSSSGQSNQEMLMNGRVQANPSISQASQMNAVSQMSESELMHLMNPQSYNESVYYC